MLTNGLEQGPEGGGVGGGAAEPAHEEGHRGGEPLLEGHQGRLKHADSLIFVLFVP